MLYIFLVPVTQGFTLGCDGVAPAGLGFVSLLLSDLTPKLLSQMAILGDPKTGTALLSTTHVERARIGLGLADRSPCAQYGQQYLGLLLGNLEQSDLRRTRRILIVDG